MATNQVGVRNFLKSQGIDDSRIGFDNRTKTVTLDGRDFFQGNIQDGRTMGSREEIQAALRSFRPENRVETASAPSKPVQPSVPSSVNMTQPQYGQQIQSILTNIQQRLDQPLPQFRYDPRTDPAYQSAVDRIRQGVQTEQANTGARLMATGQGQSSYSETLARQLANQGMSQIENEVVPTYQNQAYQRFLDQQNMQRMRTQDLANYAGTLYGMDVDAYGRRRGEMAENVDAALRVGEATGRLVQPQEDWSGLFRQAARSDTPFNISGRQQQLNETQVMAALTGYMPDGTPTTAEQQRQLENEWMAARQTGRISDTLANLYGLPPGTPTFEAQQAAIANAQRAQQIGISGGNLALSRDRFYADQEQQRLNNLYRQWEMTGVAPEGIPNVAPGTLLPANESVRPPSQNEVTSDYVANLDIMSESDRERFFRNERANIVRDLGPSGYRFLVELYVDDENQQDKLLREILN